MTALRIEVFPANTDVARHSPELGFIVNRVDVWSVGADGRAQKIAFRNFVPDSETNLSDAVARAVKAKPGHDKDAATGGFSSDPSLFQDRWMIAVPASPIQLSHGSYIKICLTQADTISSKPSLIKRARLYVSEDPRWTELNSDSSSPKISMTSEAASYRENLLSELTSAPFQSSCLLLISSGKTWPARTAMSCGMKLSPSRKLVTICFLSDTAIRAYAIETRDRG